jgi:type IV secretion system protein VirD4
VTNNQMPLMPLFSPIYTSTRPYSQTRSSTQRDLMLPDEILRLDRRQCIALFQGRKPALLYKLAPEELPDYNTLKPCKVIDYTPEWVRREEEKKKIVPPVPAPALKKETPAKEAPPQEALHAEDLPAYDLPDMKPETAGGLGMVEITAVRDEDDEDGDSPPRR